MSCEELEFHVNGLRFAALRWRDGNAEQPASGKRAARVLCLHGWLDNAASFMSLAPLLEAEDVVAIDLAGHGQSSHRSLDASYNVWEDIEDVLAIAKVLGWDSFNLVGHSRGGTIGIQVAAVMPEAVEKLVLLDAIFFHHKTVPYIDQLRQYLLDRRRFAERKPIQIPDFEKALEQRLKVTELDADEAKELVRRNLVSNSAGGYQWSYDNRLRGASALKLLDEYIDSILDSLQAPTLMITAENGSYASEELRPKINRFADIQGFNLLVHAGGHHLHMQQSQVNSIASLVNDWIEPEGD